MITLNIAMTLIIKTFNRISGIDLVFPPQK